MQVEIRRTEQTLVLGLTGDWELENPTPRFDRLIADRSPSESLRAVAFDAATLGEWDSSLLTFLRQGVNYCETHELAFRVDGLPENVVRLLDLARAVPEQEARRVDVGETLMARLGKSTLVQYDAFIRSMTFLGEVVVGLTGVLLRRVHLRWRSLWVVVQSNSWGALPIVSLIAFLVGLIISFLGAVVLRRFGAGYYVSYLVGYGMLREMGALMTGIIMAGRTGAAFAAELGTMKITEEIDAFKTFGVSPIDHLVLPRVIGLFVMMPLLVIYADFVGILGGMIVAVVYLDLSSTQFIGGLLTPLVLSDALLGVFKGVVFGLIIGLSGCLRGLQTGKDAGAVGRSATSAVVTGVTLVILANAAIDWLAVLLQI